MNSKETAIYILAAVDLSTALSMSLTFNSTQCDHHKRIARERESERERERERDHRLESCIYKGGGSGRGGGGGATGAIAPSISDHGGGGGGGGGLAPPKLL